MSAQREFIEYDVTDPDRLLTSHEIGSMLQVNPSTVNDWAKRGLLTAYRTPGGHRRFRLGDLVTFLAQHEMMAPRMLADAVAMERTRRKSEGK